MSVPRPGSPISDQAPDDVPSQDADEALTTLSSLVTGSATPDASLLQGLTPSNARDRIGEHVSLASDFLLAVLNCSRLNLSEQMWQIWHGLPSTLSTVLNYSRLAFFRHIWQVGDQSAGVGRIVQASVTLRGLFPILFLCCNLIPIVHVLLSETKLPIFIRTASSSTRKVCPANGKSVMVPVRPQLLLWLLLVLHHCIRTRCLHTCCFSAVEVSVCSCPRNEF